MRNIEESTINGNTYYALNDEDQFYDEICDGNNMTPDPFSFEFNPLAATDREYELFREPMALPNVVGPEAITILRGSYSAEVEGKLTKTQVALSGPDNFLEVDVTFSC